MRTIAAIVFCLSMVALISVGFSQTSPSVRATTATAPAMDDATLLRLCELELHGKVADPKSLIIAHNRIEDFFARPAERKKIIADLEAMQIDPNIVGRIARVRRGWSEFPGGGVFYINEKVGPHAVQYFVGLPASYSREKSWPLVIKLATADAFMTDPKPNADLAALWHRRWVEAELKRHPDAIIIMPLLNLDELYGPSYAGMNTVIQPLYHAMDRFNIDAARTYLVGYSIAAQAVWNLSLHYPTYFAAFDALAGGAAQEFQRVRMVNLRNLFPVVWHDSSDTVVKVEMSRELVRILHAQKLDVDYTETKDIGHVPSDEIVEQAYEKMRLRARELYPKRVSIQSDRPDSIFNREDWVQMYQPMNGGDEKWLLLSKGRGHMVMYDRPFKIDASFTAPNHIEATTDNVQTLRFYLNDSMVDFKRAITINVNHKSIFEDPVKPSIATVLNDQLFLGRGVRYFSAVVDIDLGPKISTTTTRPATRAS